MCRYECLALNDDGLGNMNEKNKQGSEGKFLINFKMRFLSFTGTDSPSHDACFKIGY